MKSVIGILLELQRMGVQIFLTTHDYIILKEFDLQSSNDDKIYYHSLFRKPEKNEIEISTTSDFLGISPNAIDDTFGDLVTRELQKSIRNIK